MRNKLIIMLGILISMTIFSSVALASTCNFTFQANGVTYQAVHHVDSEGSWVEVKNGLKDSSSSFDNPSAEFVAYETALFSASENHVAHCPYMNGDLGDESVPIAWLFLGAVLITITIILVHKKRLRI